MPLSTEMLTSYFDVLKPADALSFALDHQEASRRLNHDGRSRSGTSTYVEGCLGMAAVVVFRIPASVADLEDSAYHRPDRGRPQRQLACEDHLDHMIDDGPYADVVEVHTPDCVPGSAALGKERE